MRLAAAIACLALLVAAGCGGDDAVPADAVAVVDGQTIARSEFDGLIRQGKKSYESQRGEFPKAGTAEYQTLKNQAVQFLVQRVQFEQEAKGLDVEVTDKQVGDRLEQIKRQYFGGNRQKYAKQLADQGLTDKQVRADIRSQLVSEKIFANVTKDVKVTDQAIADHYRRNQAQYGTPESREVRHILVKTKQQADDLYAQLEAGADFAALAKKFSQDPGSKGNGGKLTISRGQTVAPFDQTAFLLRVGTVSRPVKTDYGYHLIEALGPVTEAKTTPLKDVRESIRQQLLQTQRNEAMTKWVDDLEEEYEQKVDYQTGFAPPAAASATTGD